MKRHRITVLESSSMPVACAMNFYKNGSAYQFSVVPLRGTAVWSLYAEHEISRRNIVQGCERSLETLRQVGFLLEFGLSNTVQLEWLFKSL